jgi:putative spermidine/putrescine transport system ATP-binding protein
VAFLGPSGCGKTTALRIIAGLLAADSGSVKIGGRDITNVPANKRNTTMVFQSYALFPHMTVKENIAFGLKMHKAPKAKVEEKINRIIDTTRLQGLADRYPRQLSGGQQQRVALARALVMNPDVLLLDEPLSNLDAKLRREMRVEIRMLHENLKLTTIFVTHDQDEALSLSDRVVVINNGKIAQNGIPSEVFEHPASHFVADFTAVRNFIKGSFNGKNFITNSGLSISCSKKDPGKTLIGVRPDRIVINPPLPDNYQNVQKALVRFITYRGTVVEVYTEMAGGHEMTVETSVSSHEAGVIKRGAEVTLAWKDRDTLLLDQ